MGKHTQEGRPRSQVVTATTSQQNDKIKEKIESVVNEALLIFTLFHEFLQQPSARKANCKRNTLANVQDFVCCLVARAVSVVNERRDNCVKSFRRKTRGLRKSSLAKTLAILPSDDVKSQFINVGGASRGRLVSRGKNSQYY